MAPKGGRREGAGRKKSDSSLQFKTVGLSADDWEWLLLWMPDGSATAQLRELVQRGKKFWPSGPSKFR